MVSSAHVAFLVRFSLTHPLQLLERQAHAVLHPHLVGYRALLAQDGDALHLYSVLDHAGAKLADGCRSTLDTCPRADAAAPADDGVQYASIMLDLGIFEHDSFLDTSAGADHRTRAAPGPALGVPMRGAEGALGIRTACVGSEY